MSQTSYSRNFVNAFSGMLGDSGPKYVRTAVNSSGVNLPAGIGVKDDSTEGNATVPAAATDKLAGIVLNSIARDPGSAGSALTGTQAIFAGREMNMLAEGTVFVLTEETVVNTDPVFVRFATGSGGSQAGSFRKTADGVAQVTTLTPTAVNSAVSLIRIAFDSGQTFEVEYQQDGSATAAEWVTGMKAQIAQDAALSALLATSGTNTLILTGATAGKAFTVTNLGDEAVAVAATTPPAATARQVKGSYWLKGASAAGVAMMYFSSSVDRAT
jgi:hypothetical protein